MKGWVKEEIFHLLPPNFFGDPIAAIQEMDGKVLKESRLRWAAIFTLPNQQRIFFKRDKTKGWIESLKYVLSPFQSAKRMVYRPSITKKKPQHPSPSRLVGEDSSGVSSKRVIIFQRPLVQGFH